MSRVSLFACCLLASGVLAAGEPRYKVAYATYFGGRGWDEAREIIVYPDGSVLVGGMTASDNLPTTADTVQPKYAGDDPALGHGGIYGGDCFLLRLSPDGSQILAATYFGGSKQERAVYGMGLDAKGNVVLTSATRSRDLPTTKGCFQPTYGGGTSDWFVAKLAADLKTILWCTYVGGSGDESPRGGLAIDRRDHVYLVGSTGSPNFPTTEGVHQRKRKGRRDAAIVKLEPDASKLVFATLLGGGSSDGLMGVRVDPAGSLYVAGHTQSADFPVTPGAPQSKLGGKSDCYLAKLSADATRLLYATYLGGRENEFAEHRPYLAKDGSVLLAGVTGSPDFPTTSRAVQRTLGGKTDGFLTRLSAGGRRLAFSTLLLMNAYPAPEATSCWSAPRARRTSPSPPTPSRAPSPAPPAAGTATARSSSSAPTAPSSSSPPTSAARAATSSAASPSAPREKSTSSATPPRPTSPSPPTPRRKPSPATPTPSSSSSSRPADLTAERLFTDRRACHERGCHAQTWLGRAL